MADQPVSGGAGPPKRIWFLWFKGIGNAPEVVRRCRESWLARNPGWEVVTLDEASLPAFTSLDYTTGHLAAQSANHRSNLVRLELLARHGGVWADATCLCMRPLDEWLPPNLGSGFFAFRRPRGDRLLATWFLAAQPGNLLVERMLERMTDYWAGHTFRRSERVRAFVEERLKHSAKRRALWFSPLLRDVLRITPYFAFHYSFEQLVLTDAEAAHIWEETPTISADPPHRPLRQGLLEPLSPSQHAEIDSRDVPVYKLTWKLGDRPIPPDSSLAYLLSTVHGR